MFYIPWLKLIWIYIYVNRFVRVGYWGVEHRIQLNKHHYGLYLYEDGRGSYIVYYMGYLVNWTCFKR